MPDRQTAANGRKTDGTFNGQPGPGRKRGVPNKVTAAIRQALVNAFEKLGGVRSLVAWGKANPNEFYKLWGRMAPTEVAVTDPDGTGLTIRVVKE